MIRERRVIRDDEVDVIRAALERARVADIAGARWQPISNLQAVSRCECGCASIDFRMRQAAIRPFASTVAICVASRWGRQTSSG